MQYSSWLRAKFFTRSINLQLPKPKLKELREMSVMSDDVDEFDEPSYLQRIAEALADEYVPTDDDDDDPWDADFDEVSRAKFKIVPQKITKISKTKFSDSVQVGRKRY